MTIYNPAEIEKKWQEKWAKENLYRAIDFDPRPKSYILIEFPYPSGERLHVGQARSYSCLDAVVRKRRMQGYNVLFPLGWDAFGLPAENYAIKTGIHPAVTTKKNIANAKAQAISWGMSIDWEREINTSDPKYYKWTQWIFVQLFKKGLAYKAEIPVNWCPSCKINLANEEVIDGSCERCGTQTERRRQNQWLLRITKYADRLLKDLDTVDYREDIKRQQINWIGRKEGASIKFTIIGDSFTTQAEAFTMRLDTIFGVTFLVIAPEVAREWTGQGWLAPKKVASYIQQSLNKSEEDRKKEEKQKTGADTGLKAVNPANDQEVPVWVADYVLKDVGTGVVMGVPAHDQRDFEFAKKYHLDVVPVVVPEREYEDKNAKDYYRRRSQLHHDLLVNLAKDAHKAGKKLMVTGGWAVFLQTGSEFRDFEDLDLVILESDRQWWREKLSLLGFEISNMFPEGKNPEFYFQATKKDIHVDIVAIRINDKGKVVWLDSVVPKESDSFENIFEEKSIDDNIVYVMNKNVLYYVKNKHSGDIRWKEKADFLFMGYNSYEGPGKIINSSKYSGMDSVQVRQQMLKDGLAQKAVTYHLRDWVFSRQHYWGEPIPMVYCEKCHWQTVPEDQLPVELPKVEKYQLTNTGESPLVTMTDWVNTTCPQCGGKAKRETDTMPNWAGSSWYYLRYIDPHNDSQLADKQKLEYWTPVDWYNGGMEHTTLHLLYSRFWHKFLYDIGAVPTSEPYTKRTSHGVVLGPDGRKMSKSKGNVINPDDVVNKYGADTLRLYEMFIGPFSQMVAWNWTSLEGVFRFLKRVRVLINSVEKQKSSSKARSEVAKLVKKVEEDIESTKFNTAVSSMMEFVNWWQDNPDQIGKDVVADFVKVLAPFAPHLAEEMWFKLGHKTSVHLQPWPKFDESMLKEEKTTIIVQINGKLRERIELDPLTLKLQKGKEQEYVCQLALASAKVKKYLKNSKYRQIWVPGKLINFVT